MFGLFCSRTLSNIINKVHERAVKVVLNDHTSDFETFQNNNHVYNHQRNIQILLIEIFKTKMIFLHQLWQLNLKGKIPIKTAIDVKSLRRKGTLYFSVETLSPKINLKYVLGNRFVIAFRQWIYYSFPCRLR